LSFRTQFTLAILLMVLRCAQSFGQSDHDITAQIDEICADYNGTRTPGLEIAVWRDGKLAFSQAYGMADLERGVPNTTETVFECGSVAKQFTAAATILLVLDGKLSLDDNAREHLPELPEYSVPITIRHLLNHTSGLRDWGYVARLEGWPRWMRSHDNDTVLSILSRQKSLNHRPGHDYSYTNSGYNLLAIVVERVSGQSLNQFCSERIFSPLGMTRTQWRDDHQRIVKDRAIAYGPKDDGGWRILMPYENAHGNGALLTTAEDLIKFTVNLKTGELGGPQFLEEMHRVGVLADGSETEYASGLFVDNYRGVARIGHGGNTAGYRAYLSRYPDHDLIISFVANAANFGGSTARQVADLFLGDAVEDPENLESNGNGEDLPEEMIRRLDGPYRDRRTGEFKLVEANTTGLTMGYRRYLAAGEMRFWADGGRRLEFSEDANSPAPLTAVLSSESGVEATYYRVPPFESPDGGLAEYTGFYQTDELCGVWQVALEDEQLVLRVNHRTIELWPEFKDGFETDDSITVVFHRDDQGEIDGLSCHSARLWSISVKKRPSQQATP
jgi:CubicO group peptidase (beta-lactamase class C family)